MDPNKIEQIVKKINERILLTKQDIAELKHFTAPIEPENSIGRISRMDAINNKSINDRALRKAEEKLKNLCEDIITQSKKLGAESAEVDVSIASGKNLTVRNEDVETFEINNDKNVTLTLYQNGRKSVVSSSDFSKKTIQHLIDNSLNMLKVTEQDPYFGIVEQDLHPKKTRPVDIFYPQELSFDDMLEIAKKTDSSAKSYDERITNSEGATINYSSSIFMYANSNQFFGGFPGSRYSLYCSVIGSKDQTMQRSYDYSNVRDFRDLKNPTQLGEEAAKNTIDRLNVKKIKTGNYPIIFHNKQTLSLGSICDQYFIICGLLLCINAIEQ